MHATCSGTFVPNGTEGTGIARNPTKTSKPESMYSGIGESRRSWYTSFMGSQSCWYDGYGLTMPPGLAVKPPGRGGTVYVTGMGSVEMHSLYDLRAEKAEAPIFGSFNCCF